jgi:hypothetical protein
VSAPGRTTRRRVASGCAAAVIAVASLGACSGDDDSPSNDPAGGGVEDGPEGPTGGGSTLVDPDVPISNLPNEPESRLDPGAPASS